MTSAFPPYLALLYLYSSRPFFFIILKLANLHLSTDITKSSYSISEAAAVVAGFFPPKRSLYDSNDKDTNNPAREPGSLSPCPSSQCIIVTLGSSGIGGKTLLLLLKIETIVLGDVLGSFPNDVQYLLVCYWMVLDGFLAIYGWDVHPVALIATWH